LEMRCLGVGVLDTEAQPNAEGTTDWDQAGLISIVMPS